MRGEPLMLCPRHPGEEGIWYRAPKGCPLCRALREVEQWRALARETGGNGNGREALPTRT